MLIQEYYWEVDPTFHSTLTGTDLNPYTVTAMFLMLAIDMDVGLGEGILIMEDSLHVTHMVVPSVLGTCTLEDSDQDIPIEVTNPWDTPTTAEDLLDIDIEILSEAKVIY